MFVYNSIKSIEKFFKKHFHCFFVFAEIRTTFIKLIAAMYRFQTNFIADVLLSIQRKKYMQTKK